MTSGSCHDVMYLGRHSMPSDKVREEGPRKVPTARAVWATPAGPTERTSLCQFSTGWEWCLVSPHPPQPIFPKRSPVETITV